MAETTCTNTPVRRPLWKALLFRGLALLIGLSPLIVLELVCQGFDLGKPTCYDDPFVGFSDIHPLFVLNEKEHRYEIPDSRLKFFCKESFAAEKPVHEYRIFVLGGSTVQGRPYEIDTSFTTWLELSLNAADPCRHWEVVNCGGISYASYRLVPIMKECLAYKPDLIIFCEGNNEFLEDRSYSHIKNAPAYLSWPHQQMAQLRTYNLLRGGILSLLGDDPYSVPNDRPLLGPEADTRLDYKGGMELFHRDETWKKQVIEHFEFNLERMASIAEAADVPLWFVCPVSNLDWPPFKSEHADNLSEGAREEFHSLCELARQKAKHNMLDAITLFQKAIAIDDRFALAHYELGKCYLYLGMMAEAREAFWKAKEEDICPLRILDSLQKRMYEVAHDTNTPLLDAEELIAKQSPGGFPGRKWLIDHVHPKIDGHKLIAHGLMEEFIERGIVNPQPTWKQASDQAYQKHFASLDAAYFVNGQLRLQGEQKWAYGHVTLEKEPSKK